MHSRLTKMNNRFIDRPQPGLFSQENEPRSPVPRLATRRDMPGGLWPQLSARFAKIGFAILLALTLNSTARADDIGVAFLDAVTTNLNGAGITVAQPEAIAASTNGWEVSPASVGQPASLFTYTSSAGTTNVFSNSVGTESDHADAVGQAFYGIPGGVATNVARVDGFEADFFVTNDIENSSLPAIGDTVVNQSYTFGPLSAADQEQIDSDYDNYSDQNKTLFISAANNYSTNSVNVCAPGTSYNCISVGAYFNYTYVNSVGPTSDNGRCKPDITAPADETSFSTPLVAGASAVLMQAALRGDGGSATTAAFDMRTVKALLLNGAVKPPDWTNSISSPLDARYGAGILNIFNSYEQLAGGKHGFIATTTVSTGGAHPPTGATGTVSGLNGWDFNTNTSVSLPFQEDAINHYYFNVTNGISGATFAATATLVWNRQQNQSAINNLNLFLYNCANSNLVLCSTSLVDNVEHIYVPQLAQGRYDLQVWKAGGLPGATIVSTAETYALAWQFVSPTLAITSSVTGPAIIWPLYPAGFSIETATNLLSPGWNTNNLPAPVINGTQNYLLLNPTNPAQFFRLFGGSAF
jgi:Subtilase family